ncbi:hypothetical protein V9T40_005852 [Parthenolecanium corni]|uniref:DUF5641 domain-containing protein n=1 Tax=Parthenolecanium corni TaxID=536013 RepID=A0AAN9TX17_9HEMI
MISNMAMSIQTTKSVRMTAGVARYWAPSQKKIQSLDEQQHKEKLLYIVVPLEPHSLPVRRSTLRGTLLTHIDPGYRQLLWTIWTEQYLLALRESKNIVGSRRATLKQPLEGDVVLMVDPSLRRGFWRTAIIDRLIRSGDGQKPQRNDGSTMSTTSPSSGCFSVALLLLTIFLNSLRASKYCSVQIVQSSCQYPGLNSNTHTNEPPIPGTQF